MAIGGFALIYAYLAATWSRNYGGVLRYEVPTFGTIIGFLLMIPFGAGAATYTQPMMALTGISAAFHFDNDLWNPFHSGFLAGSLTAISSGLLASLLGGNMTQWFQSTNTVGATTILSVGVMAGTTYWTITAGNPARNLFRRYEVWKEQALKAGTESTSTPSQTTDQSDNEPRSEALNDVQPEDLRPSREDHPFKGEYEDNSDPKQPDTDSPNASSNTNQNESEQPSERSEEDEETMKSDTEARKQESTQQTEDQGHGLEEYQFPWEEPPETRFENIGGYDTVKESLRNQIIEPLRGDTESYDRFDVEPSRGILFHGPPGTGKTLFARALANELNLPFVELSQADLTHEYINKSPQIISRLFDEAQELGGVVFIDEAEQLLGDRSGGMNSHQEDQKITNTFLSGLTQDDQDFIVLLTTNRRDNMDDAILRPGRVDEEFEIGMPNTEARQQILKVKLADIPHKLTSDHVKTVAKKTAGWSGADLNSLVNQAKIEAAGRGAEYMTLDDLKVGYRETKSATQ